MNLESIQEKPPDFVPTVENILENGKRISTKEVEYLIQEIFMTVADRGLNNYEFSLLLKLLSDDCLTPNSKIKLLPNLVPTSRVPTDPMVKFLVWFISIYRKNESERFANAVLQWIVGLVEYQMIDVGVIDIFYFDLLSMLEYKDLVKPVCKLVCLLTKSYDVTKNAISTVFKKLEGDDHTEKYILAILNVYKGFRRDLVPEGLQAVDVNKVLMSVPLRMDSLMKLVQKKQQRQLLSNGFGVFELPNESFMNFEDDINCKLNSLIPHPVFQMDAFDKMFAAYPSSILEAFKRFNSVPVPFNIISAMRNNIGFYLLMKWDEEIQTRFSVKLLFTLEGVLIRRDIPENKEEIEVLLFQTYRLQKFMLQGIPCVSHFLSGYLLNWDGTDYRDQILSLVEYSTFNTFPDLYINILRPLFMLFVSSNALMKQQILHAVINLIKNMYVCDVGRKLKRTSQPFLGKSPDWTSDPLSMLHPLVQWTEELIRLAFCLEPVNSSLLLQAVSFYEMMNVLESRYQLPMWTVVSEGVVFHSFYSFSPVAFTRVCRLLLKYHTEFLPQLRRDQTQFYEMCTDKVILTSKYAQELMNQLWNEEALSKKEDGVLFKEMPGPSLQMLNSQLGGDLDRAFDVSRNINFLPQFIVGREKLDQEQISSKRDLLALLEHYNEDIVHFIENFQSA